MEVADFIDRASGVPADTPVADLLDKRPKQTARLTEAGIALAGDARRLCPATAAYANGEKAPAGLGSEIDLARAMLWYREAVDGSEISRGAARTRLLAYNEDDVIATLRLREWLEREAPKLPRVAALDRTWPAHLPACEQSSGGAPRPAGPTR